MSAMSGNNDPHAARSMATARQRRLQHILQHYGVLTRNSLRELAGADRWQVPFDTVLRRATRAGRVRRLSSELYEAGAEPERR